MLVLSMVARILGGGNRCCHHHDRTIIGNREVMIVDDCVSRRDIKRLRRDVRRQSRRSRNCIHGGDTIIYQQSTSTVPPVNVTPVTSTVGFVPPSSPPPYDVK